MKNTFFMRQIYKMCVALSAKLVIYCDFCKKF